MAELFADTYHQLYLVIDKINAAKTNIGAYHPANADMLGTLGYWLGMDTAFYDDDTVGMGGNRLFDSYEAKWRAGGEEAVQFMREYLQKYIAKKVIVRSALRPCESSMSRSSLNIFPTLNRIASKSRSLTG